MAPALAVYGSDRDALVLGIVRGGVPAAFEVARGLGLPLDLVLLRALVQRASGALFRAARVAGRLVVDDGCHDLAPGSVEHRCVTEGVRALAAREAACRRTRSAAAIADRTIILIDNGMRTGQTMAAAIRAVRTMKPARIVAAVPLATMAAQAAAGALADDLHCLRTHASLGNVAMGYTRFGPPHEAQIAELLDQA